MKLGLGLYRDMLNSANYRFARQCGCTHIVAHYVDYFNKGGANPRGNQPIGDKGGWGMAGNSDHLWSVEELVALRKQIEEHGLKLAAIENFDPAHWYDILLDGPHKRRQLENVKTIIRNVGKAGIGIIGYNFSLAGVAGRQRGPFARGDAESVGMLGQVDQTPIPNGMVWNMVYNSEAPAGTMPAVSYDELWSRLGDFLRAVIPVAEEAGVVLAAHPDDPPVPTLRGTPRLVYQPDMYQRLLDSQPSSANQLEFCLGSLAEMTQGDIYETVEHYSRRKKVAYVHFRNVHGKVPNYKETFVDDGDIDMPRVLRILERNGFSGVLIPDHTPQMTCSAPWHAGMAYALGFMRGCMRMPDRV